MVILTDKQNLIRVEETKSGGRKMSLFNGKKVIQVYTHPSRAKSVQRLKFDIDKLEKLARRK